MHENTGMRLPAQLTAIEEATVRLGFGMPSNRDTGALLRVLAAGKPAGRLLEIGTGTGLATAWLLDGMDSASLLHTVDVEGDVAAVAQRFLGEDPRVRFVVADAIGWLETNADLSFDLIFADAIPGKFEQFATVWDRLRLGGIYVVDDMQPQGNWPDGHGERVAGFLTSLTQRPDCKAVELDWGTGLAIAAKSAS
ncbi:MAG: class I SAM-dependent methyltransferase [bacterium]|nr:class I SAM-dependent methyltransferase [bacterium]MDE0243055.1 class I SAM-dependent methyltransferase [bacterium]MDE0418949.1 class I SAM-dependent methyltransferase [bacterium]